MCDSHHWLVHEGGWTITGTTPTTWRFHTPDAHAIAATPEPAAPAGPLPYDPTIHADAIAGQGAGERFNLTDAVSWLCDEPAHPREPKQSHRRLPPQRKQAI